MQVRGRFLVEAGLAVAFAVMVFITLLWPNWIEIVFGVDPDYGSGELEWGLVAILGVVMVTCSALAGFEWWRARALSMRR